VFCWRAFYCLCHFLSPPPVNADILEIPVNDLARSFLEFVFSKNGRQVMERYGVIPVDKE
jgi:hypothetical protein